MRSQSKPAACRHSSPDAEAVEFLLAYRLGHDIDQLARAVATCEALEHDLSHEDTAEAQREYRAAIAGALRGRFAARASA